MRTGPFLLRGDEIVERLVVDLEQARLLEVRGGNPPPALQIAVDAVAENIAECRIRLRSGRELHRRIDGVVGYVEGERRRPPARELVVTEPRCPRHGRCAVQGRTE